MPNWIEPAKTARSKCIVCDKVIEKGAPRLSEETRDIGIPTLIQRHYHLRCALAVAPDLLGRALADVRGGLVIEERPQLEAKLEEHRAREEAKRQERYEAAIAAEREIHVPKHSLDPVTFQLTEQLLDDPEDAGALAVLADQLQSQNDPRGELITVQLALAAAGPRAELLDRGGDDDDDDELDERDAEIVRQLERRRVLLERFALPIDPNDRCVWGVGFVRRLELVAKTHTRLGALAAIWKNPSVRLLSELHVTFVSDHDAAWISRLVELAPASLRRLELGRAPAQQLPSVPALVAALPRLQALSLVGRAELEQLAHPALPRLELGLTGNAGQPDAADMILRLSPKKLPKLVDLAIRLARPTDAHAVCDALVTSGWLKHVKRLALHDADTDALVLLEPALVKKKLARLDLTGSPVRAGARAALGKLAKEVVAPDVLAAPVAAADGAYVLHANKPEWGRGRIVRRFSGKLEIQFADGDKRVFKEDAPFLQIVGDA